MKFIKVSDELGAILVSAPDIIAVSTNNGKRVIHFRNHDTIRGIEDSIGDIQHLLEDASKSL